MSMTTLRSVMLALVLAAGGLFDVHPLTADQAQYFYDELGRLIGVVNGQSDAAVYHYDEVGNLLKIDRFTSTGGNVGIFFFTPSSSLVNKPVEIRGFGYTSPPSSNQVSFNGTTASVISGASGSLIVTVPTGATTGPVTVANANGAATSPQAFKVLVPPIVTGVDPLIAPQGVMTRGFVEGFNLQAASGVTFTQAGLTATILAGATDNLLPINLAVGAGVPSGLYGFSVTTPSGTAQSGAVRIEVKPAVATQEVAPPVSVFLTPPAQLSPPVGASATTALPLSAFMPTAPQAGPPAGPAMSVAAPVSVGLP